MTDPYAEGRIQQLLAALDYQSIHKSFLLLERDYNLLDTSVNAKFQFLGVAFRNNNDILFQKSPLVPATEGDIFCLTPNRQGSLLVGRFHDNIADILPEYRATALGRVLFTSSLPSTAATAQQARNQIPEKQPTWPLFWPDNLSK